MSFRPAFNRCADTRVWELGAAIQVGSNLEEKEVVSKGLYEVSRGDLVWNIAHT